MHGAPATTASPLAPLIITESAEPSALRRGIPIHERRLHEAVLWAARSLVQREGTVVAVSELRLPPSRPDVVVAIVDLDVWTRRRQAGLAPCTAPALLRVVDLLERAGGMCDVDRITASGTSRSSQRALGELIRLGVATRSDGLITLHEAWRPALREVVGVEAKLGSADRARRQAASWEHHVDGVFLALPASYMRRVPRSDRELRRFGLIAVDEDTAVLVRRPRGRKARGAARLLTEEQLFARWLASARTPTTTASESRHEEPGQ